MKNGPLVPARTTELFYRRANTFLLRVRRGQHFLPARFNIMAPRRNQGTIWVNAIDSHILTGKALTNLPGFIGIRSACSTDSPWCTGQKFGRIEDICTAYISTHSSFESAPVVGLLASFTRERVWPVPCNTLRPKKTKEIKEDVAACVQHQTANGARISR